MELRSHRFHRIAKDEGHDGQSEDEATARRAIILMHFDADSLAIQSQLSLKQYRIGIMMTT